MAKHKKQKLKDNRAISKRTAQQQTNRPVTKSAQTKKVEPTIPFTPYDSILLVGEGDLSFAKSIIEHHGCCDVTATCFDSQPELYEKYSPQAEQHVRFLEDEEGQKVLFGVDARKLDADKQIKKLNAQWDVIMFNFPHVGGKSTDVNRQVRFNQELLVSFFTSAAPLLRKEEGTIVVTLFEGEPYTLWNIRDLARHSGLEVVRSFKFVAEAYPGYSHARTLGNIEGGGGWKGEERDARSYVFRRKEAGDESRMPARAREIERKRKRGGDEDSSDDEGWKTIDTSPPMPQ